MVAPVRYCIWLAFAWSLVLPCSAQEPALGSRVGVVDAIVGEDFSPTTAFVLQEVGPAQVRQYPAEVTPVAEKGKTKVALPLTAVGAPVPLETVTEQFHFTFFLADDEARFRSTPVQRWTAEELRMNSLSSNALERDIRDLDDEIKDKRVEAVEIQDQRATMFRKASQITNIEAILNLQRERSSLERSLVERRAEIERLESLIERGRQLEDPPLVDQMRKELSLHLKEAAKVTAMADRLNRRQKESAVQTFNQKLRMVKDMEREDPESLAREVLRLRRKRRELESRLGSSASEDEEADF